MSMSAAGAARLKGDFFGGITAGVVALPLALAFGVASGLGAEAGLYGAIAVGILAAVFGGTPSQVSGPTGPMTVVVAGTVATFPGQPGLVFAAVALAGLLQIGLGALRVGRYVLYIPYPVVSGFMSGIGVIIVALQLLPLLGHAGAASVLGSLRALPAAAAAPSLPALGLGLATIATIYLMPRLTRAVPASLVALVAGTAAAAGLGLDVPRIGAVPAGLPALHLPPLDPALLGRILVPAAVLAVLGSIDTLLTSLVADKLTRTRHRSDRELLGQGLGNLAAGLIGGLPGAGATMRTVVNIQAGGSTGASGAIHGLLLVAVLLGLGPLAATIPLAVLAGILITVGVGIVDMRGLRHFARVHRGDAAVMAVVLGMTVFLDLIQAVAAGMVLACLLFVKRMSDRPVAVPALAADLELEGLDDLGLPRDLGSGVYVLPLEGDLFFGNANALAALLAGREAVAAVVLDMSQTRHVDQSGAYAISDLALDLAARGAALHVVGLHDEPRRLLEMTGIAPGEIPAERIHEQLPAALQAAYRHLMGR